jgi:hypothetical protein
MSIYATRRVLLPGSLTVEVEKPRPSGWSFDRVRRLALAGFMIYRRLFRLRLENAAQLDANARKDLRRL